MRYDKQKNERKSLKLLIVVWALLTGYLFFHTWQWDPETPFLTTRLLTAWFAFALLSGTLVGASGWDSVFRARNLQLRQALGFGTGFALYLLFVLAFNAGVFVGVLFALDSAMSRLNPNAGMELVTLHPSIGPEANRYLLLLFFIAVTIAQVFSIIRPLAQWFSTSMESWLNLTSPPTPPEMPDKLPSRKPDEEHLDTPEARYFRTAVLPGGRVEVASPELEAGRTVDVVVNPVKCRMGRKG